MFERKFDMEFGELLREILKDIGVSVSRLSSDLNYNRVALYAVFNGEKKLPGDIFDLILEKYDFSNLQRSELIRLFYIENLSRERTELLRVLKDELEEIGKERFVSPFPLKKTQICDEGVLVVGSLEYYSAVAAFFENEKECENNTVYTNYSFFDAQTDAMVYNFVRENRKILIKHTVRMDVDSDIRERIRNVCSSVKFAKLGHVTNIARGGKKDFTFATYFIGKRTVLQYDAKNECGFLSKDEKIVDAFRFTAIKNEKNRELLTGFSKSALDLKTVLSPHQKKMTSFLDFRFPANLFTTKRILSETVRENVFCRDAVIDEFWNHLESFQKVGMSGIFSQRGIQEFAKTGVASDASPLFLYPISIENRKELFERYKENIKKTDYSLKIINSDRLKVTEHCAIEVYSDGFSLLFRSDLSEEGNFIGGCYIICKDKELAELFTEFKDYIVLGDGILSKKYAEILIDDLIGQCSATLTTENG